MMLHLIPLPLREAVSRLLHVDPEKRPTIQVLSMIKYFQYVNRFGQKKKEKGREHF